MLGQLRRHIQSSGAALVVTDDRGAWLGLAAGTPLSQALEKCVVWDIAEKRAAGGTVGDMAGNLHLGLGAHLAAEEGSQLLGTGMN
jgi:hypothetical protein